jgi:hypothetical protein
MRSRRRFLPVVEVLDTRALLNAVPVLAVNTGLSANGGTPFVVTVAQLQATDADNTDAELVFKLSAMPTHGVLKLNGSTLAVGSTFTQQDIDDSKLTYTYQSGALTDGFSFSLSDGTVVGTQRVDVSSTGVQTDGGSGRPAVSDDGQFVVFQSQATNLVTGDTNGFYDVFLYDVRAATTTRISMNSSGVQGNGDSINPTISSDDRYIVYYSGATNLVAGDTNNAYDIFQYDRVTGLTTRLSVDSNGNQANGNSFLPRIATGGRYVVYHSDATNLVSGDTNGTTDVFVYDRTTGQTTRASVGAGGTQGNGASNDGIISSDGRYVSFTSAATNLVSGDTNGVTDVFVRDLQAGTTTRVSVSTVGVQGNALSSNSVISGDGRWITYSSNASNLVSGDTNAVADVFLYDRQTATTTRVSVSSSGVQSNGLSGAAKVSADGHFISFYSGGSNLVANDTNSMFDTFLYDRITGAVTRVSGNGIQPNGSVGANWLSSDGRYLVEESSASNLVPGDTNGLVDLFMYDQGTVYGTTAITVTLPAATSIIGRVGTSWWAAEKDAASNTFNNVALPTWTTDTYINVMAIDVNGDGRADLVGRSATTGVWQVSLNQGNNTFTSTTFGTWSTAVAWVDVQSADLNGDGKMDIAGRVSSGGQWWAGISSGTTFVTSQWLTWSTTYPWVDVHLADMNGDGKADVIGRSNGSWNVGLSNGSAFTNSVWGAWAGVTWVDVNVADVNGDGKADVAGRVQATGQWYVNLSTGTALADAMVWTTWSTSITWTDVKLLDMNNDGKADLFGRAGTGIWVGVSSGSGFDNQLWATWAAGTYVDISIGDFNGDGKRDVAGRKSGSWYVATNTGTGLNTETVWTTWSDSVTWTDVQAAMI